MIKHIQVSYYKYFKEVPCKMTLIYEIKENDNGGYDFEAIKCNDFALSGRNTQANITLIQPDGKLTIKKLTALRFLSPDVVKKCINSIADFVTETDYFVIDDEIVDDCEFLTGFMKMFLSSYNEIGLSSKEIASIHRAMKRIKASDVEISNSYCLDELISFTCQCGTGGVCCKAAQNLCSR